MEGGGADHERRAAGSGTFRRELGGRFAGGDDAIVGHGNSSCPQPARVIDRRLAGVVGHEDDLLAGFEQRPQRIDRSRHHLPPDPDDPVQVDQQSVEFVRQRHLDAQAIGIGTAQPMDSIR
ncbi:MAG TPA: hypothetical protein VLK56_00635 [Solirubrobacterales bacterium]|nr:hypothetical protein [Solirubrobacterales bacterium]